MAFLTYFTIYMLAFTPFWYKLTELYRADIKDPIPWEPVSQLKGIENCLILPHVAWHFYIVNFNNVPGTIDRKTLESYIGTPMSTLPLNITFKVYTVYDKAIIPVNSQQKIQQVMNDYTTTNLFEDNVIHTILYNTNQTDSKEYLQIPRWGSIHTSINYENIVDSLNKIHCKFDGTTDNDLYQLYIDYFGTESYKLVHSLQKLVAELYNMIVPDTIAELVNNYRHSMKDIKHMDLKTAAMTSGKAYKYAHQAYYHPSITSVQTYPTEHKYAIYRNFYSYSSFCSTICIPNINNLIRVENTNNSMNKLILNHFCHSGVMQLTPLQNYSFQVCIATIWKKKYGSMNKQSLQLMTSVLARYMLQLGKISSYSANYAGRTETQLVDVLWALEQVGVDFRDLIKGIMRHEDMYAIVDVDQEVLAVPKTNNSDENIPSHLPEFPDKDAVKTSYTPAQVETVPIKAIELEDMIMNDAPPLPDRIKDTVKKSVYDVNKEELLQSLYDAMNEANEVVINKEAKIKGKQLYMDAVKRHPLLEDSIGTLSDHFQYNCLFPYSPFFDMPNHAPLDTSVRTSTATSNIPPGWLLSGQKTNIKHTQQNQMIDLDINDYFEEDHKNEENDLDYRNSYLDGKITDRNRENYVNK